MLSCVEGPWLHTSAVLQGALDGGLDIPHGVKRFVGYDTEGKKLDTEQLQKYILGGHVSRVSDSYVNLSSTTPSSAATVLMCSMSDLLHECF